MICDHTGHNVHLESLLSITIANGLYALFWKYLSIMCNFMNFEGLQFLVKVKISFYWIKRLLVLKSQNGGTQGLGSKS